MDMNSDSTSTSDGIPQPLVFNAAGFQPDVSLMVFDQDFHVNSVVLKLYSAYFRKFLDSAEKNGPLSGQFAYKYTTVVDPDGMWALEPVAKVPTTLLARKSPSLQCRRPPLVVTAFFNTILAPTDIYFIKYANCNIGH